MNKNTRKNIKNLKNKTQNVKRSQTNFIKFLRNNNPILKELINKFHNGSIGSQLNFERNNIENFDKNIKVKSGITTKNNQPNLFLNYVDKNNNTIFHISFFICSTYKNILNKNQSAYHTKEKVNNKTKIQFIRACNTNNCITLCPDIKFIKEDNTYYINNSQSIYDDEIKFALEYINKILNPTSGKKYILSFPSKTQHPSLQNLSNTFMKITSNHDN
jgi:hypothetical protein